jgi:hypothetical protein
MRVRKAHFFCYYTVVCMDLPEQHCHQSSDAVLQAPLHIGDLRQQTLSR